MGLFGWTSPVLVDSSTVFVDFKFSTSQSIPPFFHNPPASASLFSQWNSQTPPPPYSWWLQAWPRPGNSPVTTKRSQYSEKKTHTATPSPTREVTIVTSTIRTREAIINGIVATLRTGIEILHVAAALFYTTGSCATVAWWNAYAEDKRLDTWSLS